MKSRFTSILILSVLLWSTSHFVMAQKAFLGGGGNASMPVVNYENFTYSSSLFGGHSGQVKYVVTSSDGNFLYFETIDVFSSTYKIHKVNAITLEYVDQRTLTTGVYDLEISDDNSYLFFHNYSRVFKLNTASMIIEDSIQFSTVVSFIEVYDNNTVYGSSLNSIHVIDFISGNTTEIPTSSGGHLDMAFNSDKTKLYTLKASPHKIIILDVNTLTIETDTNIEGTTGLPWDIALDGDDQYIYALFSGVNGTNGTLRVLNANDLSTVTDISTPEGYGKLAISPDNKLWVPAGASSQIAIVDIESNTLETTLSTTVFNSFYGPYTVAFSPSVLTGLNLTEIQSDCEVYPNPSHGTFHISLQSTLESVEVISMTGKLIQRFDAGLMNQRFYFVGTHGSYIIKVNDCDGNVYYNTVLFDK
ncbi:MAG: T9SS type A sorting domain-containing protein [Bacteroidales bacterium]|nr:T9SS type A sorting domain-containing protein [Bacteroidales bacterium]MCF8402350.1 T9SS type A sorting domain-containing protein [Bacteroidales bacterium]